MLKTVVTVAQNGLFYYYVTVIANGISSDPYMPLWVDFNYTGTQLGTFPMPYSTPGQAVANVSGGIVAIKGNEA